MFIVKINNIKCFSYSCIYAFDKLILRLKNDMKRFFGVFVLTTEFITVKALLDFCLNQFLTI